MSQALLTTSFPGGGKMKDPGSKVAFLIVGN